MRFTKRNRPAPPSKRVASGLFRRDSKTSEFEVRDDLFFAAHDAGQDNGVTGHGRAKAFFSNGFDQIVRHEHGGLFVQDIDNKQKHLIDAILVRDVCHGAHEAVFAIEEDFWCRRFKY